MLKRPGRAEKGRHDMRYKLIAPKKELEIKKIATLFYMEYDKNFDFPGEKHDFWEMVYCDRGEVNISGDGDKILLKKGMIAFHQPGEFHTVSANKKVSPNIIVISFVCTSPVMEEFKKKLFSLTDQEQKMLAKIVCESNNVFEITQERGVIYLTPRNVAPTFGGQQYVKNLLEIFLIELVRRHKFEPVDYLPKTKLTKMNMNTMYEDLARAVLAYFEEHLCETIRTEDLCAHFSLSKSYLEYIFKRQTGQGLMGKFTEMKIERAKDLLRNQDYNITQISEILGFSSVHYFSRRFKAIVGMSPSEYATSIKLKMQLID